VDARTVIDADDVHQPLEVAARRADRPLRAGEQRRLHDELTKAMGAVP
jgi:hypothetical protein